MVLEEVGGIPQKRNIRNERQMWREHDVLEIAQLSLIRVTGAYWGIMENNASEKTSLYNFRATD